MGPGAIRGPFLCARTIAPSAPLSRVPAGPRTRALPACLSLSGAACPWLGAGRERACRVLVLRYWGTALLRGPSDAPGWRLLDSQGRSGIRVPPHTCKALRIDPRASGGMLPARFLSNSSTCQQAHKHGPCGLVEHGPQA